MSCLVSVDVLPDRREEEQRECESELIESGQAVRCTECGKLLTSQDKGYCEYLCEKCADKDVNIMLDTLQTAINRTENKNRKNDLQTLKNFCSTYRDIFKCFLLGEVEKYERV